MVKTDFESVQNADLSAQGASSKPVPADLIRRIAKFRAGEIEQG
jgi:hypothetical protein